MNTRKYRNKLEAGIITVIGYCITVIVYCLTAIVLSSCSDDLDEGTRGLTIAAFYPDIVMDGTEITISGTSLGQVREVVFPGGVTSTSITQGEGGTISVKAPAGVSETAAPLVLRTENGEIESRQTLRRAHPEVSFYQFEDAEGAMTTKEMTIYGNDLILVDWVAFTKDDASVKVDALNFVRKSNTAVKLVIPEDAPIAEAVSVTLGFKNNTSTQLSEKIDIQVGKPNGYWSMEETTVFEGEHDLGGWSNALSVMKADLTAAGFAVDATLRLYVTMTSDGQLQTNNAQWSEAYQFMDIPAGTDHIDLTVTEDFYNNVMTTEDGWSNCGIIFNGRDIVINKITVIAQVWINGEPPTTDPITDETIMLNSYEQVGDHNCWWDGSWSDSEATTFVTDEATGNTYMRLAKDLPDGWLINCNHQDIGTVHNIENYAIKFDILIEEDVVGASKAAMQFVLGDNWIWVGENFFPETTGSKWITVSFNLSDIKSDLTGDLDIGTNTNGMYGSNMPAGICIDNYRLDPKSE